MPETPSLENKLFPLNVPAPGLPVCELNHGGRDIFNGGAESHHFSSGSLLNDSIIQFMFQADMPIS
jgi:hypothetical protein